MNVIKLILIIGAILGFGAVAATPATAQTIVWTGNGPGNSWHTLLNWDQNRVPNSTDDVLIASGNLVVISSQNAECKTLDIEDSSRLEITGKTLTLGDSTANTTSNLDAGGEFPDGTIRFVKSGSKLGILKVHQTVTFTGGGTIDAPTSNDGGIIKRASASGGIVISDAGGGLADNAVIGNITLHCDVTNDGARFGVEAAVQTMVFGDSENGITEPQISGTGKFRAEGSGTIQFTIVTFAASTPKWVIEAATIEVTDDAGPTHWRWVSFDIDMVFKNGLLDLKHHFSCLGTLPVTAGEGFTHTIDVAVGKVAQWVPKTD